MPSSTLNDVIMEREKMVEETTTQSEANRLRFDAEGNNNDDTEYNSLGNHNQSLKEFDADEISVIGYTDDNNAVQTSSTLGDESDEDIRTRNALISAGSEQNAVSISNEASEIAETADNIGAESVVFSEENDGTRHKNASSLWQMVENEPIHMTLEEVQLSFYDWDGQVSSEPNDNQVPNRKSEVINESSDKPCEDDGGVAEEVTYPIKLPRQLRHHRPQSSAERWPHSRSLKHTLCHWLGLGRCASADVNSSASSSDDWPSCLQPRLETETTQRKGVDSDESRSIVNRALPPLPCDKCEDSAASDEGDENSNSVSASVLVAERIIPDFAKSICKVKDCGWYWGPISGEMAERILSSEPDGSFVVRDSSDERYIFSLTFKLNGFVRHVRIEHDHGNFSFGSFTNFKSHTIVEFIENAVRHSRSGRYLFFLHRRPALGPMRVQLLYPVSRFKRVQSLQHMCRFVILKAVRRDLIASLPLPAKLKNYLDTQQYYTEQMQDIQSPVAASINFGQLEPTESVG